MSHSRLPLSVALSLLSLPFLGSNALPAPDTNISGRWKIIAEREGEQRDYLLLLRQDGAKVSGDWISPRSGRHPFEGGSFKDGKLIFEVQRKGEEETRVYRVEVTQKEPRRFEGEIKIDGSLAGTLVMTPAPSLAVGKWNVVSKTPNAKREFTSVLEIAEEGGALKGTAMSQLGSTDVRSIKLEGEKLSFEMMLNINGNDVTFTVQAEFEGPDKLVGSWKAKDKEGTGDWVANRAVQTVAQDAKPAEVPAPEVDAALAKMLTARWYGTSKDAGGKQRSLQLDLRVQGEKILGKLQFDKDAAQIQDGKLSGRKVEFSVPVPGEKGDLLLKVEAEVGDGDVLKGKFTSQGGVSGDFTARKPVSL